MLVVNSHHHHLLGKIRPGTDRHRHRQAQAQRGIAAQSSEFLACSRSLGQLFHCAHSKRTDAVDSSRVPEALPPAANLASRFSTTRACFAAGFLPLHPHPHPWAAGSTPLSHSHANSCGRPPADPPVPEIAEYGRGAVAFSTRAILTSPPLHLDVPNLTRRTLVCFHSCWFFCLIFDTFAAHRHCRCRYRSPLPPPSLLPEQEREQQGLCHFHQAPFRRLACPPLRFRPSTLLPAAREGKIPSRPPPQTSPGQVLPLPHMRA